jgi:hypothetical protein
MKRFFTAAIALGVILVTSVVLNLAVLGGFPWSELPIH